ncbi:hypothetical protein [Sphingomonas sp. CFBP 8760]|uniref:hypothetical protein n=1 Tax=Sphingomonas sp. CFBP 8760 TaxID=2775282 RepID=UPI00177F4C95|nr:hypothetical protein [Sphingomonas sp. CFBP 8760]MBD8548172.1 hypothetical protein [Sphingomonas sp. CFBP 8760]
MFHFGLYLLSFAANTLVILTAPADLLRSYVLIYNGASVVFSLLFFIYFSQFATVRRSIVLVSIFVTALLAIGSGAGWYETCIIAYPGLLILTDYLATQSYGIRVVTGFRILMIVSAAPFLLMPAQFTTNIVIRVALLAVMAAAFAIAAKESHRLLVKSPIRFQIGNYLFYNGTLSLMALVVRTPEALRWWYLAAQIGLVLILKVLDYSLRRAYSLDRRTRWLAMAAAGGVPLVAFPFYPNLLALGLFYVGFTGLTLTGRYITN